MMTRSTEPALAVGLIGFGLGGATFHAPFINGTPGLRLAAVLTRDSARRALAERAYPATRVVESVEDMLASEPRVELVAISSPSGTHFHLARELLRAGVHVVVDKPFAGSAAEAIELAHVAHSMGRLAIPFQNRRWDGDFLTVQRLLRGGAFGDVYRFESRFDRWRAKAKPRWCAQDASQTAEGIVFDIGTHLIDQALVLFGPAARVSAETDRRHPDVQVEDDAFISLTHASGVRSHLYMSSVAAQPGLRMSVHGSRAAYIKYGLDGQEVALIAGARPGSPGWGSEPRELWGHLGVAGVAEVVQTELGAYERFYAGVADAVIRDGAPPVLVSEAIEALTVLDGALQSAREGRVVSL